MLLFVPQIDFHDSYSEAHSAGDFGTVYSLSSYSNYFIYSWVACVCVYVLACVLACARCLCVC